jgi:hypothetical protein
MVHLDFIIVPLDLHFNRCYKLIGYRQFILDLVSFQFASSYSQGFLPTGKRLPPADGKGIPQRHKRIPLFTSRIRIPKLKA